MKTELEIVEELIDEKTKEFIQANGVLMHALENYKDEISFGAVEAIYGKQLAAENAEECLQELHAQRLKLLGDFKEEEAILGSKKEVLTRLEELPDGIYKLMKVEREDSDGEE